MNNSLQRLNNVPVSSYITSINPITGKSTLNPNGTMIIYDNTGENKSNIITSDYGFFVDDVFIAGGYGFPTVSSYTGVMNKLGRITYFDEKIPQLEQKIDDILFEFKWKDDNKLISPQYNTYGFVTSYQYFSLTYTGNSYLFSLNNQPNVTHISNISISKVNDIPDYEENDAVVLSYSLTHYSAGVSLDYNNRCKINIGGENIDKTLQLGQIKIQRQQGVSEKDIELVIKDNSNNILYSYIYPSLAKWYGNVIPIPQDTSVDYSSYSLSNYVNFRDTSFSWTADNDTQRDQLTSLKSLLGGQYQEHEPIKFEYNKKFNITFNSGETPLYDYILLNKQYNAQFWFNGLKADNWMRKQSEDRQYYIYQSPQQYIGEHTWTIQIDLGNN